MNMAVSCMAPGAVFLAATVRLIASFVSFFVPCLLGGGGTGWKLVVDAESLPCPAELFNGTRVDEKCDVYSLGCLLYECGARR